MVNSVKEENKIIIFCQAPADIPYVLSLYEKYKEEKVISVYVINVENIFKFINGLNLNLKSLVFIPYALTSFKNVFQIIKERKRIKSLKKQYFDFVINTDVYFFSRFEDWLTSSFLDGLEKKNSIYYIDHYDFSSEIFKKNRLNFKLLVLKFVYYILTDVNFKLEIIEKLPEFQYYKYGVEKQIPEINKDVFYKYRYEIDIKKNANPIALFFISPCETVIYDCVSHDEIQLQIIKSLKEFNWNVIVKGHPRLGVPDIIMDIVDVQIPSYIPAEFVQIENVSMCIGIITSALAHFAKNTEIKTYSLLNLFQFKDFNSVNHYRDYLSELSNDQIIYFQDYNDFENNVKNKIQ
jgi:hypothetical protein